MSSSSGYDDRGGGVGPPATVRRALLVGLGLMIVAGVYLAAVRGDAILLDLAGLGQFFCL